MYPSIHCSMGSAPVGVQCPLTEDPRLLGLALVSWAFSRVGVHRLSLCLPYLGVFHSLFFTIGFHSSIFSGDGICTPQPTLLLYLGLGPAQGHGRRPEAEFLFLYNKYIVSRVYLYSLYIQAVKVYACIFAALCVILLT